MNPPKCSEEDYINFVIASPKQLTATEAATQIDLMSGVLVLDDSTLDKPYSKRNDLVYRHRSGKHHAVVSDINLISLLWTNGKRAVPSDYRIFDKDTDEKTKNDHFAEMLLEAHNRSFSPALVCFNSWYASIENLKLVRGLSWRFLTRLKSNRRVNPDKTGLKAVSEIFISAAGRVVWLAGFGLVKVFRIVDTDGTAEHWATSIVEMNEENRREFARQAVQIEQYHRRIKQYCLIERAQVRRRRPWQNHILLCLRAFLRLESHSLP